MSDSLKVASGNATLSKIKAFGTRGLFWLGGCLFVIGNFITFVPGADEPFFIVTAILTAFGLLVPKWFYRIAAVILLVASSLMAYEVHRRGVEYREDYERHHMDGFD